MVEYDAIDYLRSCPDLDAAAETAFGDVALVSDLNVSVHTAIEADLLDDGWQALMVRLLLFAVLIDLVFVLS
jgi:hypothetical protein